METLPCIDIRNLNKTFKISNKGISLKDRLVSLISDKHKMTVKALSNINLEVNDGEFVGIIGKNGSGKSTLLKLILGAIEPDEGSFIQTRGRIIRLALGMGFDISLSARDNIYLNGTILGLSFKTIGEKFDEIIEFSELEKFVDTPIKYFSSGMRSRLSFAVAIHADADIFLVDEFFSDVGDEIFKERSQIAFEEKIKEGKTIIHVSHSMELLQKYAQKVLVLEKGEAEMFTDLDLAIEKYKRTNSDK